MKQMDIKFTLENPINKENKVNTNIKLITNSHQMIKTYIFCTIKK